MMIHPEPKGYEVSFGASKRNPLNNAAYIATIPEKFRDDIKNIDAAIAEIAPGYNIDQITFSFGWLQYVYTLPVDTPDHVIDEVSALVSAGEELVSKKARL